MTGTEDASGITTAALVAAARTGDHAAFAVLIRRYHPMVQALAARVLGDQDQAGGPAERHHHESRRRGHRRPLGRVEPG